MLKFVRVISLATLCAVNLFAGYDGQYDGSQYDPGQYDAGQYDVGQSGPDAGTEYFWCPLLNNISLCELLFCEWNHITDSCQSAAVTHDAWQHDHSQCDGTHQDYDPSQQWDGGYQSDAPSQGDWR